MKRIICITLFFVSVVAFSQSLVKSDFMYQLPRTSDDFQNYQFNYPLENGIDVISSYYMDSEFSGFDGVGIFPFELQEKVKVKSIHYAVCQKNGYLAVYGKASYNSKGELSNYEGKNKISENYVYGFDRWNEVKGVSRKLVNCVPNSFTYETRPTRNSKGLITNVESELVYTYDSQDRVVEVNLRNDLFSYHYEYIGASKNIRKITVYQSGRLSADAVYGYSNNKIVSVDCNQYMKSGNEGSIESENHKSYSYDSNNGISEIIFSQKKIGSGEKTIHYTFNHKYDSKGKVIESQISRMKTYRNYKHGSDKAPTEFVRKYTYDEQGNWIKIEDNKGYIQRIIEYRAIGNEGDNDIYDEEEVTVNATFGETFSDYFKHSLFYPVILEENNIRVDTSINASFIVEVDGSVSNVEIENNSSERERFIGITKSLIEKLPWIPASVNGRFVRCRIDVGFRTENFDVIVTKDIKFTKAERDAYKNGGDIKAKNQLEKTKKDADQFYFKENVEQLKKNVATIDSNKKEVKTNEDMSSCWFVFGKKRELESENVIANDKIADNFNKEYFSEVEKDKKEVFNLYSSAAKVLSNHPSDSYELSKNDKGYYYLRIIDPSSFWTYTNYLVIVVE